LLKEVMALIDKKGFKIGNIDTTICLQEPKIGPYIEDIKACLSRVMDLDIEDISIKATTTETLGFVGKKEGVAAHAVVLIYKD
jgi:2-C-methyl-D-erythritol 2,4-cyclodiphosphate synthase